MTTSSRLLAATLAVVALGIASEAQAQTTFTACRVPDVGAIYMIGVAGAPSSCLDPSHVEFSWTEGGALADGSVTTAALADGAVTQAKLDPNISLGINPGDVGTAELADDAVTSAKILDGTIAGVDIGAGAIGSGQLATDAVDANAIAPNAVGSTEILDGSISAADLMGGAVDAAALGNSAVYTAAIQDGAVTASKLAGGMPAINNVDIGFSSFFGSSWADVSSVSINAPSAGFVLVQSSGNFQITGHTAGGFSSARVGVTDVSGTVSSSNGTTRMFVGADSGVAGHEIPYSVYDVFAVTPGLNTFYLIGIEDGSNGSGRVYNANLMALFIPG